MVKQAVSWSFLKNKSCEAAPQCEKPYPGKCVQYGTFMVKNINLCGSFWKQKHRLKKIKQGRGAYLKLRADTLKLS